MATAAITAMIRKYQVWFRQVARTLPSSTEVFTASGNALSARIASTRLRPSKGLSMTTVPAMPWARMSLKGGRSA